MVPNFWKLMGVYAFALVVTAACVVLAHWAIERFVGAEMSGGSGIVASLVAALAAGQAFYKWEKRLHTGREAWAFAGSATLFNVVIGAPILIVLWSQGYLDDLDLSSGAMAGVVGLVTLLHLLLNRFFFGFGIKQMAKVDARG